MKTILLFFFSIVIIFYTQAQQGITNKGIDLSISEGSALYITDTDGTGGNYTHQNGEAGEVATIFLDGSIYIQGDWENQSNQEDIFGAQVGNVVFYGNRLQNIAGITQTNFGNVLLDNNSDLELLINTYIDTELELNNGLVILGTNNLIVGTNATIVGSFDRDRMLVADNSGKVVKQFSAHENFTFPVGDNTGDAEYSPIIVGLTAGTYTDEYELAVNLENTRHPEYSTAVGDYINRYWKVTSTGVSDLTSNIEYYYTDEDVVGRERDLFGALKGEGFWENIGEVTTSQNRVENSNLSELGDFTAVGAPDAPEYTINFFDETTNENIPSTTEYNDHGDFLTDAIAGDGNVIVTIPDSWLYFRFLATYNTLPSKIQELDIPQRPDAPIVSLSSKTDFEANFKKSDNGGGDDVVTDDGMEYSMDSLITWDDIFTATVVDPSGEKIIMARFKATEISFHSFPTENLDIYTIDDPLVIFDGLTPNNDNVNDYFRIENIQYFPNNTVTIFNRNGNIVYESVNYQNDWAGTYYKNNEELPTGTYYYIIDIGTGTIYNGSLLLIR